jgi:hypothetical protein
MCLSPASLTRTTSIPFVQVAFLSSCGINALFCVNQALNGIFVLDMIFTFFTPVADSNRIGGLGGLIKSHRQIARAYFRGWFPIECAATRCLQKRLYRTLTTTRARIAIGQFHLSAAFRHHWYSDEGKLWRLFGSLLRPRTLDAHEVRPAASPPETYVITIIGMHPATAGHHLPICSTLSAGIAYSLLLHAQSLAYCAPHAFSAGGTHRFR